MEIIENSKNIENIENTEIIENITKDDEIIEKIENKIIKKPRTKMNLSDEERKRRSDRMKLARVKKNEELEKQKLLMEEFLKQQEEELEKQILKKIETKTNRKKKDIETDYIQKRVVERKTVDKKEHVKEISKPIIQQKEPISFFKVCK